MPLNYKHLYYFWTVAREGSIRQASDVLHITPQTISGQLGLLEESIAVKLFAKTGRNLTLTRSGRLAYRYADDMFSLGAQLQEALHQRADGRPLVFSVGIVDVVPKLIAYRLLEPALRLSEPVHIQCFENKLPQLLAELALHKLDLVLADSPLPPSVNVRAFSHLLGECGTTFFAAPPLAAGLRAEFPASLGRTPLLLPSRGTMMRNALMQWFDQQQIRTNIVGEFDDSALMKAFGQAGGGVFPAPSVIENEVCQQYNVVPVGYAPDVREQFYVISAERRLKHPAVVAVTEAARSQLFSG